MLLHTSFVTLIFALSAFGASIKRDTTQVQNDITDLEDQTEALDTSIDNFPSSGGTLAQAMAIHEQATNLANKVQTTTTDITASSAFSQSEGSDIMTQAEKLASDVEKALSNLVDKKPAFTELNVAWIVQNDLATLQTDTQKFGTGFVAKVPGSLTSAAQKMIDALINAFETAKQAYAS